MNKKYILNYIIYTLLQLTWGFIQNALGIFILIILTIINPKRKHFLYHGAIVSEWKFPFSCGCGMFIYYGHKGAKDADAVLVHEYGHTLQSIVLGPLFMFVIAIPSITWAFVPCFVKMRKEKNIKYVDFYPEKWANAWGEKVTGLKAPER